MQLTDLDNIGLFSLTAWKSADGWTLFTQRYAGDQPKEIKRATLSAAILAFLETPAAPTLPPPPYQS